MVPLLPELTIQKPPRTSGPCADRHLAGLVPDRSRFGLARQLDEECTDHAGSQGCTLDRAIDLLDTGSDTGSLAGTHWVHMPAVNDR
jgi:hypothetical protein